MQANLLRIIQFNILAPSARICAPLDKIAWKDRHTEICRMILELLPDIVCLQEFCFVTPEFSSLYNKMLCPLYSPYLKRRTGGKPEGIAIFIRSQAFCDTSVEYSELEPDHCNRVAIFFRAKHIASGRQIVVATTHLTVAHLNSYDVLVNRPKQSDQVLKQLERLSSAQCSSSQAPLVFLCADMNCDHLETFCPKNDYNISAADVSAPVVQVLKHGYSSAFHESLNANLASLQGKAAIPIERPISHVSSYSQDGCVDYVFFRSNPSLQLSSAYLYPASISPSAPWSDQVGWAAPGRLPLSDHRPLVADFHVSPSADILNQSATTCSDRFYPSTICLIMYNFLLFNYLKCLLN